MAQVGVSGSLGVNTIGGNKSDARFGTDTPAGWAMGIWVASVIVIAFFLLSL